MPGSVIAMAVMSDPSAMPGSQRSRCSGVPYSRKYGREMSLWREIPRPAAATPA